MKCKCGAETECYAHSEEGQYWWNVICQIRNLAAELDGLHKRMLALEERVTYDLFWDQVPHEPGRPAGGNNDL